MTGERLAVNGTEWLTEIVEHWPPGGPDDRPMAYDVFFYDPEDRNQWVGNPWVPADLADLSEEGLGRLFREASVRSWRDARGMYWRIRVFRPGTIGSNGDGGRTDGVVAFAPRDASESRTFTRVSAELPPVGEMGAEELERLVPRSDARTPLTKVLGRKRVESRRGSPGARDAR